MKIGILGASGRMGKMIAEEILSGEYAAEIGAEVERKDDKNTAFDFCDVLIDFTLPASTVEHCKLAAKYKKPLVIGTTGFGDKELKAIKAASKETAILQASNMSLGVNLLFSLVEQAAKKLDEEFDIEIYEAHHKDKIDSPSGTALSLVKAAANGREIEESTCLETHNKNGKRTPGKIGMSVMRGGDIVGEHTVTFASFGERLELTHKSSDRAIFAKGAIKAALWMKDQPTGLYSMKDVLGL